MMEPYEDKGPVDCSIPGDPSLINGKSVIVTGGANGLGEAYVRSFLKGGAFVTVGDLDEVAGAKLASEFPENVQFVPVNVTSWNDQLQMFKAAISRSTSGRVDIVIANAGISGPDPVFLTNGDLEDPEKPELRVLNTNLTGAMYTIKLALHYFKRQSRTGVRDTCLILQGSMAAYLGSSGTPQYCASKYGLRGLMICLRRTSWQQGTRINLIAPWAVKTTILSPAIVQYLESTNVEWALAEDCAAAAMKIVTDKTINGRSLAIVPRSWSSPGYIDFAVDDYSKGHPLYKAQETGKKASFRTKVDVSQQ